MRPEHPNVCAVVEGEAVAPRSGRPDAESRGWLEALNAEGPVREEAVARLHALLLRAARFELSRRRGALAHVRGDDLTDIAAQSADDALVAVLAKLDRYRGESRFTTWAYKFALLEAAVGLRRRAWQGREITLDPDRWPLIADGGASAQGKVEARELVAAIRDAARACLTPHQREVLVAITLDDVPLDVLAERLSTNRNALYKTLHDARRKLRAHLAAVGLSPLGGTR